MFWDVPSLRSHMPHQPGSASSALPCAEGTLGSLEDFEDKRTRKPANPVLNQAKTKMKMAETKLEEIQTLTAKVLELQDLSPVCTRHVYLQACVLA